MKPSTKIGITLVVMALLTLGGLIIQYRVMSGQAEPVHVTAEQIELLASSTPAAFRNLADPNRLREALIFGAAARRLGYAARPDLKYQMQFAGDLLLSEAYKGNHPEVDLTSEELSKEIDAYFSQHPDVWSEFLRYNPRFQRQGESAVQRLRRQFGEIRILAGKARDEELNNEPGVKLQLEYFPQEILREPFMRDLQKKIRASQEEIQEFYRRHQEELTEVRARHILFSTRPSQDADATAPPPDREAVRQRALEVLERARAGEDFAELAKEYSDDPGSRDNGGDLDYFRRGRMTPKFEEASFELGPGQISDLVETPFGFHIIKVEDRRITPMDQALKGTIENRLRQRKLRERRCKIKEEYPVIVDGAEDTECEKQRETESPS